MYETSVKVDYERKLLQHIFMYLVKQRPLAAVVIITDAKKEVRSSSKESSNLNRAEVRDLVVSLSTGL